MISDVLHDAVDGLDDYLGDPLYDTMYSGELRDRLIKLRNEMSELREELDHPPAAPLPPTGGA